MVGVPRSKGCRICVQRRVKCDQTRPVCLRCLKGNRPCPGYDQGMKFQDEGPKLRQHFEKSTQKVVDDDVSSSNRTSCETLSAASWGTSSSSSPEADHSDLTAARIARPEKSDWFAMFEDSNTTMQDRYRLSEFSFSTPSPDSFGDFTPEEESLLEILDLKPSQYIPSPLIQQQQLLYTFISSMTSSTTVELSPILRNHTNWLARLPLLSGTNPLLDTAVRACTLAHLGRLNGSDLVMHESQGQYGRALRLLSSALQDTEKGMSGETLSATILLSFYEMLVSDSDQSWVRHAGGASTLIKMRGPARHRTGFGREIFLAYRHALIIQCLETQIPCFLDEPKWRQLCKQIFEDLRASGAAGDKLDVFAAAESFFHEMAQLPGLMCDARDMAELGRITKSNHQAVIESLVDRANNHLVKIKTSHILMIGALNKLGHTPASRPSGDWIFPIRYDYTNVFSGGMYTGYWTVMIIVNTLVRELEPSTQRSTVCSVENVDFAQEICTSAAWMSKSSFLGPFILTFALRACLLAFDDETRRTWVLEKLRKIGATRLSMAKELPFRNAHPDNAMPRVRLAVEANQRFLRHEFENPS